MSRHPSTLSAELRGCIRSAVFQFAPPDGPEVRTVLYSREADRPSGRTSVEMRGIGRSSAVVCALSLASVLLAQLDTGNITVAVKDASGLAVPGAKVVIRNEKTGINVRTAATNEQGTYSFEMIRSEE